MGDKIKAIPSRNFRDALGGDFQQTVQAAHVEKNFLKWDARARTIETIGEVTRTLTTWLDARFAELVFEKVPMEEVKVHHFGAKTVIYARGVARFEFKIKCTMGKIC